MCQAVRETELLIYQKVRRLACDDLGVCFDAWSGCCRGELNRCRFEHTGQSSDGPRVLLYGECDGPTRGHSDRRFPLLLYGEVMKGFTFTCLLYWLAKWL